MSRGGRHPKKRHRRTIASVAARSANTDHIATDSQMMPEQRLAAAVIQNGIRDYFAGKCDVSWSARNWFNSERSGKCTYRYWAELAGISDSTIIHFRDWVNYNLPDWVFIHSTVNLKLVPESTRGEARVWKKRAIALIRLNETKRRDPNLERIKSTLRAAAFRRDRERIERKASNVAKAAKQKREERRERNKQAAVSVRMRNDDAA